MYSNKTRIIAIILFVLFFTISSFFISCTGEGPKTESGIQFNQEIIAKKNSIVKNQTAVIDEQATSEDLINELKSFKDYSDKLFPLWLDHINNTSSLFDDFNESIVSEEKLEYSKTLEKEYLEFKVKLEDLKPPPIAIRAGRLAVDTVSYRILFFERFNENAPSKELFELEDKAYLSETSFWEEIDNIYKYFEIEITRLGIEDESTFLVFN